MTRDALNGNHDILNRAIAEIQALPTPELPARELLLERISRQSEAGRAAAEPAKTSPRPLRQRWGAAAAVAASVLIVFLVGIATVNSSQTALAQVIESTTKHRLVKYQIQHRGLFKEELKNRYVGDVVDDYTIYADLQLPRMRLVRPRSQTGNGVADQSWDEIIDFGADRRVILYRFDLILSEGDTVDLRQRQAIRAILHSEDSPGTRQRLAKILRAPGPTADGQQLFKPYSDMGKDLSLLDTLEALQTNKATVESKDALDGRNTTKYVLKRGDWTSTLWVDPNSKLPVRVEHHLVGPAAGEQLTSRKWTYTDFTWDPKVESIDRIFDLKIPDGYTVKDFTKEKRGAAKEVDTTKDKKATDNKDP